MTQYRYTFLGLPAHYSGHERFIPYGYSRFQFRTKVR